MIKAYYTATNGAISNKNYLDVLSNNMANIQTVGFKKSKAEFSDLVYTNIRDVEGANSNLKSGSGSKVNKVDLVFSQGAPYRTGLATDFAIVGDGFFSVQFEEENLFTRGGNFEIVNLEGENYLMYQGGYVLDSNEEPIFLENPDDINNVSIGVFTFYNNEDLEQVGNNLYRISNEYGEYEIVERSDSKLMQGFLEASNVEVSEEMVKLIQLQKAFQLNSKVIQTADEIQQVINSLRG
ncbi:MAG: flagellar hook-basal body protein [Tissierellia bacterium]|nr:flagellar hook-basal body protein [Tissierellia bacterium]